MELVKEVVEDLVGRTGQAAGGGEGEVGGHEEVGEVFDRDVAGDGEVVAGQGGCPSGRSCWRVRAREA